MPPTKNPVGPLVVIDLDTAKPGQTAPDRGAALSIGSGADVLRALAGQRGTSVTSTFAVRTMAARYQHLTTTIRQDVAQRIGGLLWEPAGDTTPEHRGHGDGAAGTTVPAG